MASGSASTGGRPGSRSRLHGDAFKTAGEQRERFVDDLIHVAGARLRRGKLGQRGELVDQCAQGSDAGENDLAAFANDGWASQAGCDRDACRCARQKAQWA